MTKECNDTHPIKSKENIKSSYLSISKNKSASATGVPLKQSSSQRKKKEKSVRFASQTQCVLLKDKPRKRRWNGFCFWTGFFSAVKMSRKSDGSSSSYSSKASSGDSATTDGSDESGSSCTTGSSCNSGTTDGSSVVSEGSGSNETYINPEEPRKLSSITDNQKVLITVMMTLLLLGILAGVYLVSRYA